MRLAFLALLAAAAQAGEWVPVEVVATAYCPCSICCGVRAVGITADGTKVSEWPYGIAVDPQRIAYSTPILVPHGVGYLDRSRHADRVFYADDTGGIIRRRTRSTGVMHIDLRYRSHQAAKAYGKRSITVFIWRD